jgi:cytochrome c biogenesis protein CcmG, thiol:disulfide interchange protein DsbE
MRRSLRRRRFLVWYYCGLASIALLVGTFAAHAWLSGRPPSTGTLLLMASSRSGDHLTLQAAAIHSGSGWVELGGSFDGAVSRAPDTTRLRESSVPAGDYDALRVAGQVIETHITIPRGQVEPVLVTVAGGRPAPDGVYTGSEQLSVGLQELAGRLQPIPAFQLTDQNGNPLDGTSMKGKVTVVAAFHTTCQTTCPLYTGLFFQLSRHLPPSVRLVEVTTDPEIDTPQALKAYASQIGASWTFATGDRQQLETFWNPLGVQLSGAQLHTSTLAVIDDHGYIRSVYQGIPDVGGTLPAALRNSLNAGGRQELATHGDGWGISQVLDTLAAVDRPGQQPSAGGDAAPAFSTTDLSGRKVDLAQFKGRPLLINFWASWCTACRQEMPMIQKAARAHPGLAVVLVDERDSTGSARQFLSQLGIDMPVATDPDGTIGGSYRVSGLPTSVFVRPDGAVSSRYPGAMDQRTLEQHLAQLGSS